MNWNNQRVKRLVFVNFLVEINGEFFLRILEYQTERLIIVSFISYNHKQESFEYLLEYSFYGEYR